MKKGHKIALVTGAGSGIGKATSLALMAEGYSVVLAGRRSVTLEAVATEGKKMNATSLVVPTDVSNQASVQALFASTIDKFGRLDLLFNNAGITAPPKPMEDLTIQEWRQVIDINLTGVFMCTQEAIKIMKVQTPQGGRIINNGSISAQTPRPNSAPYTSSKHGITGLTKTTSLDCRKYNIACGQIDIGNADTEITQVMKKGVPQADGSLLPEPLMDVEDVAKAIVYMDSLSLESNVQFMTVLATKMPFIGRG